MHIYCLQLPYLIQHVQCVLGTLPALAYVQPCLLSQATQTPIIYCVIYLWMKSFNFLLTSVSQGWQRWLIAGCHAQLKHCAAYTLHRHFLICVCACLWLHDLRETLMHGQCINLHWTDNATFASFFSMRADFTHRDWHLWMFNLKFTFKLFSLRTYMCVGCMHIWIYMKHTKVGYLCLNKYSHTNFFSIRAKCNCTQPEFRVFPFIIWRFFYF